MQTYKFKDGLQTVLGKDQESFRAVDIIADACQQMEDAGMGHYAIAMALYQASLEVVLCELPMQEYVEFSDFARRTSEQTHKTAKAG